MKLFKKLIAVSAAVCMCMTFASCSAQKEDTGVADEKNMKISTAADLEGKAVAVQLRSAEDEYIVSNQLTKYPRRYSDMTKAVQDLVDKKVAAVVVDSYYAKQLTDGVEGVKIAKNSVGKVEYRFLLNRTDVKLVEKLNKQIAALKESEEYGKMIESELEKGKTYSIGKDKDAELKNTYTFVTEPNFRLFVYESKGKVKGLFPTVADSIAYNCGAALDIKTVEAAYDIDNAADTVKGVKKSFSVVWQETAEDDAFFMTTDAFYTSELVMIIRAEEKK